MAIYIPYEKNPQYPVFRNMNEIIMVKYNTFREFTQNNLCKMHVPSPRGWNDHDCVFIVFRSKADKHDFLKHSTKVKNTLQKNKNKKKPKHIMQRFDKCILKQNSKLLHCPHPKAICRYNQMFAQFSYITYMGYLKWRIKLLSIKASVDRPRKSTKGYQKVSLNLMENYSCSQWCGTCELYQIIMRTVFTVLLINRILSYL